MRKGVTMKKVCVVLLMCVMGMAAQADIVSAPSFNSWNQRPLATEGGGWWSLDVSGVKDHNQYRYVIDGSIWKTDPYAKQVVNSHWQRYYYIQRLHMDLF